MVGPDDAGVDAECFDGDAVGVEYRDTSSFPAVVAAGIDAQESSEVAVVVCL